jgi:hypothetical protein
MKLSIFASSIVFLASAAFAQSVPEKAGVNSTVGIAPKTQDFVTLAAQSDMLEIDSSKLALKSPSLRPMLACSLAKHAFRPRSAEAELASAANIERQSLSVSRG